MIGACLIFKDSASYLHEWLAWHIHQGIEHFWLYDNGSQDDWCEVVQPWRPMATIEALPWPGKCRQLEAYADCLNRARGRVQWLAFIDDDEFLQTTDPHHSLLKVLDRYRDMAGVAVPWMVYGSAGANWRADGWVIERFTHRAPEPDMHVKCIVRPERILAPMVSGHQFQPVDGHQIVDENFQHMTSPFAARPSTSMLRINHYLVKSWAEYRLRRLGRPPVDGSATHPESSWREWDIRWSMVHDPSPLHHLVALRALSFRALTGRTAAATP